jgi:threonine aldolase
VHTRQIPESEVDATISLDAVRDAYRRDDDDHYAQTTAVCLENTHNVMGGVALPVSYMDEMGRLAKDELNIQFHVDGARIFNSAVSQNVSVERLCRAADSVSVCLSKGLGAPLGSVVVGNTEFIRLAKRARKRCGGGMRQAGVVAAMGLYALHHHVDRLAEDHARATRLGAELGRLGFVQPRNGQIDTNIVYFGLPPHSLVTNKDEFIQRVFDEHNVRFTGGYSKGGRLFRLVAHKDIDDEGIDRTLDALTKVSFGS